MVEIIEKMEKGSEEKKEKQFREFLEMRNIEMAKVEKEILAGLTATTQAEKEETAPQTLSVSTGTEVAPSTKITSNSTDSTNATETSERIAGWHNYLKIKMLDVEKMEKGSEEQKHLRDYLEMKKIEMAKVEKEILAGLTATTQEEKEATAPQTLSVSTGTEVASSAVSTIKLNEWNDYWIKEGKKMEEKKNSKLKNVL